MTTQLRQRWALIAAATATSLVLAACGGGDGDGEASETDAADGGSSSGGVELEVLIASSGDAETTAVTTLAQEWAEASGNTVNVLPAQDLVQQMGQGFAGGNPADAFYVGSDFFRGWNEQGSLRAYGDQITDPDDLNDGLSEAFTADGTLVCAPKDTSTLALQINTDLWEAAGLTDADIPTDWNGLQAVAEQLTADGVTGLVMGNTFDRVGAFFLQAGGWVYNEDATEVTADSPENLEALTFIQDGLQAGWLAWPGDVDAGWGGEALGLQSAAMVIEGNWIRGAMSNDYPDVNYTTVELPAGPAGLGTMQFTVCWGVAAQSSEEEQAAAIDMIDYLLAADNQVTYAENFPVMPSRDSALATYAESTPDDAPFVAGTEYGVVPPNFVGWGEVRSEFDSQLIELKDGDPAAILADLQTNIEAAVG